MTFPFIPFRFKLMTMKFILAAMLLMSIAGFDISAQSKVEIRNMFYDAESWILFEDYKEALPLYQQLLKIYPTNANIKYRIGQCYINTPGEKEKAVSFLEDAVKNINPDYKEGKYHETNAPYDALYYLANAYRINNQIDKALETYKIFKQNMDPEIYDSTIVNFQIQSCLNAKELMSQPLFIREKILSNSINDRNSEFNPVVSDKEDMMVFSRSEAFYDAILFTTRQNGTWSEPMNLNELLMVDRDLFPTGLSKDGKTLYLYSSANYDGIIFTSRFENGSWSPITKLNENINTKFWESHATVSHDNKKLYFTSNRKGSLGGLDIYVSKRDSTGDWGPAENLGPVINTPYNEESPFLSNDDKTLFFSSRGHYNMGGYDIFYSTLLPDGNMSVPLNVGFPLNSTDDDVFFKPLNDGYEGYFAKEGSSGFGKQDIYRIEIFSDDHPRKFLVRGFVKAADLFKDNSYSVKVSAMNIKNPDQMVVVYSDPATGEYELVLPHGNYNVTYEGEGTEKMSRNIELPIAHQSDSVLLPGIVLPKSDFSADLNIGTNQTISFSQGDSILFPLKVEPGSKLRIEHYAGDSLLYAEEFMVQDSVFNYRMLPAPGENKVVFILTDKFNNTTTTEVFITREKEQPAVVRPEYNRVIAQKQAEAFLDMLKNRSDGDLRSVLSDIDISGNRFGTVDDLLSYIKEEAAKRKIQTEEVDKLALKVAVMDNVLTQAAVDYLEKHSEGELKNILSGLDIYQSKLKTWNDLQQYIATRSERRITPEILNEFTGALLGGDITATDQSASILKDKILIYAENSDEKEIITLAVEAVDLRKLSSKGPWLSAFAREVLSRGLSKNKLAGMLAAISILPDTDAEHFLTDLVNAAEEPLTSSLKSLDLKKENIRTPEELILFLMTNDDRDKYPEDTIYNAIAEVIVKNDVPGEVIAENAEKSGDRFPWWLIVLAGATLIIFLLFARRKKKDKSKIQE